MATKKNKSDEFVPDVFNDTSPTIDYDKDIIEEFAKDNEKQIKKASRIMPKMSFPSFVKTREVVDHILVLEEVTMVANSFGGTSFYLNAFDETTDKTVIITGGSAALLAQLKGSDIEGARVILRQRGQSYEFQDASDL